jgi:hypothetical protein
MRLTVTQTDGSVSLTLAAPGTIPWPTRAVQGTVAASTSQTTIDPTNKVSVVVTVSADTTLNVASGYAGQTLRLEVRQDSGGGHGVGLGTSIVVGADVPAYTPSVTPNTRDLLLLIAADTSHWMLVATNHGFGV